MAAQPDDQGEPARPWRISTGGCESWVPPRHLASSQPAEGASPPLEETPVVEQCSLSGGRPRWPFSGGGPRAEGCALTISTPTLPGHLWIVGDEHVRGG